MGRGASCGGVKRQGNPAVDATRGENAGMVAKDG